IVFDLATIDDIVQTFSTLENAVAIQIKTPEQDILSSYIKENTIPQNLFDSTIKNREKFIFNKEQEYLFTYTDVIIQEQEIASISFVFNVTESFSLIQENRNITFTLVFIALMLSLLIAYIIGNNIGKSFDFLTRIAQSIATDKKVDIPYSEKAKDEVGKLFYNMHLMQDLIHERTTKLNKSLTLFGDNVISSSTDTKGKITYVSQAFCDISGYTKKELLGKSHAIIRHPDTPTKLYKDLWTTVQNKEAWYGEIQNLKKDGTPYWVRASIIPNLNTQNNIIGYTSIRQDITPQKAKEQFMANMSHELRTPLNAIIGFSGILEKKIQDSQKLNLVKQITDSSKSLLTLINDILNLSKIKDSKFTIEPIFFNAYNEITEHSKRFKGISSEKNIFFTNTIDKSLEAVFNGDWHRIDQIILNLISNAIKFTPDNGEINCNYTYENEQLTISVEDNGIGMKKEVQDKIFKPFEQADGSTTRKYGGTGLGLSITQSLVELMQGTIELESQEDKGTKFIVKIPLEKIVDEAPHNSTKDLKEEIKKEALTGHILVVEDNKTNQMLIQMLLEDFGITSDIANDGVEAVEIYNPNTHNIILMDENMPNMNGLDAMEKIREKYKEQCTPIIALTANAMEGDKERFLNLGMDGYIAKPIDENLLYLSLIEFLKK
ncbi:ATP-binding protein, partial [Sulfurimonas sp.]|nr:ATP-binding protein [Sulfurimonas sp.]